MNLPQTRTIAYIDGLNLFHSMGRLKIYQSYCDVQGLVDRLLLSQDHLTQTRYYTSFPGHCSEEIQNRYLISTKLLMKNGVCVIKGKFKRHDRRINRKNIRPTSLQKDLSDKKYRYVQYEEKGSDVALASDLISDAHMNKYDKAVLLSSDSDFIPPVLKILSEHKKKHILILLPPTHKAKEMRQISEEYQPRLTVRAIKSEDIESCLLPN